MSSAQGDANPWRERRVTVMGLGLFGGGAGVARWFAERGAIVTVTDLRGAEELAPSLASLSDLGLRTVLGRHEDSDFAEADFVVANPAVRPDARHLTLARAQGATVTSELALFHELCPAPQIWVTGTQGKSSTAHALAQLLGAAGRRVHLAGNIGRSLLLELAETGPGDVVVAEVSSYQLECLPQDLAARRERSTVQGVVITNVLADHLERHGTVEAYLEAKARLFEVLRPGGWAVVPAQDERLTRRVPGDCLRIGHAALGTRASGANLHVHEGCFQHDGEVLAPVEALRMPGRFQIENALAALGAAHLAGVPPATLAASLVGIRGLPHRMVELGVHAGRRVVDNGVSTTPDSTVAALDSIDGGCTLLLGGKAKAGLGFEELAQRAAARATRIVTFGEGRSVIGASFRRVGLEATECATLDEAVRSALDATPAGETLLFSPAAASFDAYSNFRQRALAFHAALGLGESAPAGAC